MKEEIKNLRLNQRLNQFIEDFSLFIKPCYHIT